MRTTVTSDPATGLSTRLNDFLSSLDKLVDYALNNNVDLVLFCGDAYKTREPSQTQQRDEFIAGRINETLAEGETGILFIGAYHDVVHRLAPDIRVGQVKEVARVKEYHKSLINTKRHDQQLQELGEYLVSPVSGVSF